MLSEEGDNNISGLQSRKNEQKVVSLGLTCKRLKKRRGLATQWEAGTTHDCPGEEWDQDLAKEVLGIKMTHIKYKSSVTLCYNIIPWCYYQILSKNLIYPGAWSEQVFWKIKEKGSGREKQQQKWNAKRLYMHWKLGIRAYKWALASPNPQENG